MKKKPAPKKPSKPAPKKNPPAGKIPKEKPYNRKDNIDRMPGENICY